MQKAQMRVGTNIDFFGGAKDAVLSAQNHRKWFGPIETSKSVANHAILHAQNGR